MRRKGLAYTKTVRAKGKVYVYFDTGEKDARGKVIYKPLPSPSDKSFGSVYAAMLGHRERRTEHGALTVKAFVEQYHASQKFLKLQPSTQKLYRIYQGRFADMLPTAPADRIERLDIVTLFDRMSSKTPGAANMLIASVSALYRWGRRAGLVTNRPADDIDENDLGEHEPWPDELLRAALESDDPTVRMAVHLLYYTAQRIGDVAAMRWSMISDGVLTIRQQKTRKDMVIPLHPALCRELDSRDRDLRTILLNDDGKAFNEGTLRRVIQNWAKGRGVKIVPHGLRKNAVNALLEVGCSVAQTAAISGQSLRMVEYYARRRSQSSLARSAMKLWGGTEMELSNGMENSSEKGGKA
ncbi:tyrosine-type recombinase/integrase [Rhizorhapis suberifaciens]|uniref:Integrase n=1 Tax=Rhizorhapis suberifaciens TaxID=13656 RepID=A0A840HXE5_9SPHN|nr:tyrosine-type recombinase/integrase [Rhizorhapis suberifaciens]MBB4642321.1 integrase [Rhizorhapis suberifaciens]